MGNLFTFKYWFNMRPGAMDPRMEMYFMIFLGLTVLLVVIFWQLKNRTKGSLYTRVYKKAYSLNLTNLIVGLFLLFFTHELIPLLSSRLWFLLWAIGNLIWLFFIGRAIIKIPLIRQDIAKQEAYKKYLP